MSHLPRSRSPLTGSRHPIHYQPPKRLIREILLHSFRKFIIIWNYRPQQITLILSSKITLVRNKKGSDTLSSPLHHHISLADMTQGFKKWKESTTTSPFTRYLGHYNYFLVSDGKDNDIDHCSFNNKMLQNFNTIINVTIESGHPLQR